LVQAAGEPPDAELMRRTTAVAVEPLPPARVERWMAHRARQLALTLAPEAGALLLDAVGSDLAALARELEKLAALGGGGSRPAARPYGLGSGEGTSARWARWEEQWSSREPERAPQRARDEDRALKSSTLSDEAGTLVQLVLSFAVLEREVA